MRTVTIAVIFLLLCSGICFAHIFAPQADAAPVDSLGLKGLIKGLFVGAFIGLTVAFLGYAKDRNKEKKFDLSEASPTILLGAVIGGLWGWNNKDLSGLDEWKNAAATILVGELMLKAGWRNSAPIISNIASVFLGRKSGDTPK